jgi:DNA-binding transcriptional LysR family regulator
MGVVCRSDHRLATRRKLRARDLERWSLVGFDPTLPVARDIRRYLRANGLEPRPGAVVDNVDTMKMLVAETQQIAILPLRTVQKEVEGGVLHAIELEPPLARPMAIIQARGSRLKAAARSLADFLLEHAGPASVSEPFLSRVAS